MPCQGTLRLAVGVNRKTNKGKWKGMRISSGRKHRQKRLVLYAWLFPLAIPDSQWKGESSGDIHR